MKMAKPPGSEQRFVLLGSGRGLFQKPLPARVSICHDRSELEVFLRNGPKAVTLVSFNRTFTDILLERVVHMRVDLGASHLLTLTPPRLESIPALLRLFHPVFGLIDEFRWLPRSELIAVITRDDSSDRFIGGSVDLKAKALALLRGNLEMVVAPFSLFEASGDGVKPDFTKLGFTDHGRTVVLGDYQAASDAILYGLDPEYRRQLNKQRRQTERTFGASLMRLRKQRRLRRSDFSPISSKEVARIERNEVAKPHERTLRIIARRLGAPPEELGSY
jgi:hypothetical protein